MSEALAATQRERPVRPSRPDGLGTEDEIEEEANSHTYAMRYFKVASCEYKRFFLFALMFGIISFIYSFMRILKDTYVMVRQEPNCILYIKILYILPLSFLVVLVINYMLSFRSLSRIFSVFCVGFMALFFSFGCVILLEDRVFAGISTIKHPFDTFLCEARGLGFLRYTALTISQPLATLIYITAELWGSIMLSYLFLSFLNEACTRRQHGRFIPALFIVANLSLLVSAVVTTVFFKVRAKLNYEQNTMLMAGIFFIEGALTLALLFCKYVLERRVLTVPLFYSIPEEREETVVQIGNEEVIGEEQDASSNSNRSSSINNRSNLITNNDNMNNDPINNTDNNSIDNMRNNLINNNSANNQQTNEQTNESSQTQQQSKTTESRAPKSKASIGFAEGLEIMSQSKFLLAMSTIVFFFSVLANILETVFKNGIKRAAEALGKEKGAYSGRYNNMDQYMTSIIVIALNLSPFSDVVSDSKWVLVAVISPIVACVSAVGILGMATYNSGAEESSVSLVNGIFSGATPFYLAENYIGMVCLSAIKIFKFTAFDVSKEKISMRIADEYRPKFKSVFDGIFNKFGKSFGAIYGIAIGLIFSDIDVRGMAPVTALFAFPFISAWLYAVYYLGGSYEKAAATGGHVDIDLIESKATTENEEKGKQSKKAIS